MPPATLPRSAGPALRCVPGDTAGPGRGDGTVRTHAAVLWPGEPTLTTTTLDGALPAVRDLTHGCMANTVVMTMAAGDGRLLESALSLVGSRGTAVIVNVHPAEGTAAT